MFKFSRHLFRFASVARETETEFCTAHAIAIAVAIRIYLSHALLSQTSIYLIADFNRESVRPAHTSPIRIQLKLYDLETEKFEMEMLWKKTSETFCFANIVFHSLTCVSFRWQSFFSNQQVKTLNTYKYKTHICHSQHKRRMENIWEKRKQTNRALAFHTTIW